MRIDIWADIVCPFCYLGKRNLDLALQRFEHADNVEVVWHSFQLDPDIERHASEPLAEKIATKFGISLEQSEQNQKQVAAQAEAIGLTFNWREAKYGNTFDAHRLVHLAGTHGLATETVTQLMQAYFVDGEQIGGAETLNRVSEAAGLPRDEVTQMLASDQFAAEVRGDIDQARQLGINGVPFFVLEGKYAVSGAQPADALVSALDQVWAETHAEGSAH